MMDAIHQAVPPEPDFWNRLHDGDVHALQEVIGLYWKGVWRYAYGFTHSLDDADDTAQETFVRLWELRGQLSSEGFPEALIFRIAGNIARDQLRHRRATERRAAKLELISHNSPATPEDLLLEADLSVAATTAVAALPKRRREIFLLVRRSGLSYKQVSKILGISPQTVANQMTLAMQDLRKALASYL